MKKCLILSDGPVPTPAHTRVEGGGLRCWGLAKGIQANSNKKIAVSVAYNDSYVPEKGEVATHQDIRIRTWNFDNLASLLSEYDTIIVSYCMGNLSVVVTDLVRPDQQLVLDCYVPIYVEVSARQSDNLEAEYAAFHGDIGRWAHVLRRGDLFLCASEAQKKYYFGVLSALGRINPATYEDDLILVAPYGIYRDEAVAKATPVTDQLKDPKTKRILWFGGIYPWFDLRTLLDAVKIANKQLPVKLVIVGAKNPFNKHPDFVKRVEDTMHYIESNKAIKDLVIMQDWVRFEDRADWYLDSDLVVVINKIGNENTLAWRTRLVDFMWANLPIITNAGDPLGDRLVKHDAAVKFHELSAEGIARDIVEVFGQPKRLSALRKNLKELKKDYYWDVVTKQLSQDIIDHRQASDRTSFGDIAIDAAVPVAGGKLAKVKKIYSKARLLPDYTRRHGYVNTYHIAKTAITRRLGRKIGLQRTKPATVFIAHQMDLSGAPYVFMDLLKEYRAAHPGDPVEFHTYNPSASSNLLALNRMGIRPLLHMNKNSGLEFVKGDVVVLNTVAHSTLMKDSIFGALENNTVKKLIWYIHEDEPELIFDAGERKRIQSLLESDKIVMYVLSKQTAKHYQKYFKQTANIKKHLYRFDLPEKYQKVRTADDFDKKLSFMLPGTMGDGRKGQLPVFYAFEQFKKQYYDKNPRQYRNFELVFVGVEDDFLSRQVLAHAGISLGKHFVSYPKVTREESLKLIMKSNVTVCYSLREALPLFVFEGMIAGHPLLRNDCSGREEQLFEGKNGFYLDSKDHQQMVTVIEQVLNKKTTSAKQLADMSAYSYKIAKRQADNTYDDIIADIADAK